jgi:acetyl esterase/lipase
MIQTLLDFNKRGGFMVARFIHQFKQHSGLILISITASALVLACNADAQARIRSFRPRPRVPSTPTPTPTATATPTATPNPSGPPVVNSSIPAFTNVGPFTVGKKTNLIYGANLTSTGALVDLKLDIYYPVISTQPLAALPVIVYIHGGGWMSGTKDECFSNGTGANNFCQGQTARGYIVVTIDYRLSGQALFPAQIQDVKAAIRYLRKNANAFAEFKIDETRIAAIGTSAGGHLASLLGTSVGASQLEGVNNLGYDSSVQAVASFYGPSDFLQMDSQLASTFPNGGYLVHNSSTSPESRLLGCTINSSASCNSSAAVANPITYASQHSPPFIFRHGKADVTVPYQQSGILDQALKSNGVYSDLRLLNEIGHGFSQSKCANTSACTADVNNAVQETTSFFDRVLRGL